MKNVFAKIVLLGLIAFIGGCAVTHSTHLIVGKVRPETSISNVKIYLTAPAKYEEIALISADSAHDFMDKQKLLDVAVEKLKEEAAKIGANGVILDNSGDFRIGNSGVAVISSANRAGPIIVTGAANDRTGKQVSGKAIYVIEE